MVALAFFVATLFRGTSEFRYDALYYWWGAQDVVGAIPSAPEYFWELRGVLTAVVYTPAAAFTAITDDRLAGLAVLVQNAVVLAWAAGFLIPMVIRGWRPMSARSCWVAAAIAWMVLSGFAPYPLVDIYPALLSLALLVVLRSQRWHAVLSAGVLAGVAVNLRPSHLLLVLGIAIVSIPRHRWRSLLLPLGAALAVTPQVIFNAVHHGVFSIWPSGLGVLLARQATFASYTVRYDTVFGSETPRLFFCSPSMAQAVSQQPPTDGGEFAGMMLAELPQSLWFAMQKLGASLRWPLSTPYMLTEPGLDLLFAGLVTAVTVVGVAILARRAFTWRGHLPRDEGYDLANVATLVAGGCLSIVGAAAETRFGLPLVLIGIIGFATVLDNLDQAWRRHRWAVLTTLAVLVVVFAFGQAGLSTPMPDGDFSATACAAL